MTTTRRTRFSVHAIVRGANGVERPSVARILAYTADEARAHAETHLVGIVRVTDITR